jgi:hypothetical protein
MLRILYNSPEFTNWAKVLRLLQESFSYREARKDPPGSRPWLDVRGLVRKTRQETVLLAFETNSLVVHVFLKSRSKCLYLEKWRFLRLVAVAVLRAP